MTDFHYWHYTHWYLVKQAEEESRRDGQKTSHTIWSRKVTVRDGVSYAESLQAAMMLPTVQSVSRSYNVLALILRGSGRWTDVRKLQLFGQHGSVCNHYCYIAVALATNLCSVNG